MSTGSLLSIGLSGLNAAQAGLSTTGHNIANVNTPNFSRQQVIQSTQQPMFTGGGFLGQGTSVETVRRVYSGFLTAQTQQTTASATQLDTLRTQLQQLDGVLGDTLSGLAPALADFFGGVNGVAANPGDVASRQVMISDAQALAGRFHQIAGTLEDQRSSANDQIAGAVGTINAYATQIADANRRIAEMSAASGGLQQPNDLLDTRDGLLSQLNQLVGVTSVAQSDGSVNVFLSSGNALVVGTTASTLVTTPDPGDPANLQFGMKTAGGTVSLASRDFSGGSVGGLLLFRDTTLGQAQNALGQVAAVLATTFNDQHRLGIDLGGAAGGDFFAAPVPQSQPALTNTAKSAALTVSIAPGGASALTASDYRVSYDGTNYAVERLSDHATVYSGALPKVVDGLQIGISGGPPGSGDSFLVQPTRHAAEQIGVTIADPRKIAAASPSVRTSTAAGNTGAATIDAGVVSDVSKIDGHSYTIRFSVVGPATYSVVDNAGATLSSGNAYTSGSAIDVAGRRVVISGSPDNGDAFGVGPDTSPVGDNRNARVLAGLQSAKLVGGVATYDGAYGQLVGFVGASTQQAQVEADGQDALLVQAQNAEQAVSGVNLDEEAANLQRYQQAYQASAKMMTIAASLFDTILAIGN